MVEACEADEAESLTKLTDFMPRKMKMAAFVDRLDALITEAETARLRKAGAGPTHGK